MTELPPLGALVRFRKTNTHGAGTGIVYAIHEAHVYDEANERSTGRIDEITEWSVSIQLVDVPDPWPYANWNRISKDVSDIELESNDGSH